MARGCELQIREHMAVRMRKRAEQVVIGPTPAATAAPPPYTNIQNTTCLTAPEVTEGPYYINNEFIRTDITESQPGVRLLMDFGVLDTTTCTPMNHTFVEIWHANATGEYAGYHPDFDGAESWLRGGWYTDANGMVELTTVYPGHYPGRSPHVHLMVHKDWTEAANGTLVSHSGTLVHIGQTFFEENWSDEVYGTSPYSSNTHRRTPNVEDIRFDTAFQNGYNAYTILEYLNGKDLSEGLVGYLTVGVDPRSTYTINNEHYNGQA